MEFLVGLSLIAIIELQTVSSSLEALIEPLIRGLFFLPPLLFIVVVQVFGLFSSLTVNSWESIIEDENGALFRWNWVAVDAFTD